MTVDIASLVSESLDIWTTAVERKSGAGRGGSRRMKMRGIELLRALILSLAVRGRLLPQDADDQPAVKLVELARVHLRNASASIGRQRWKASQPFSAEERKQFVPTGWALARVNDTGFYINGLAFKPSEWGSSGRPIIRIQNLTNPSTPFNYATGNFPDEVVVRDGDILVSWSATLATFQWRGDDAILNQHIFRVIPTDELTNKAYLRLILEQAIKDLAAGDHAHGLVMAHINRGPFLDHLVLIPPLAEQQRIVAKVDELMALCDVLEMESAAALAAHQALVEALLATLTASTDAADLATNWARLETHFDTLFTTEASVDALKRTVLAAALTGKFSPRTEWPCQPVELKSVARLQNGYAFKSEWFCPAGVRLLRNINVGHGDISWSEVVHVSDEMANEFHRFQLQQNDVVLTLDRPFISTGTKVAKIVMSDVPSLLLQRVGRFQPTERVLSDFIYLWVCSPLFSSQIDPGRSNGVPHISSREVEAAMLYVPGVAEQSRVISKVAELMSLCDAMKADLTNATTTQRHLADSVVERAAA